MPIVSPPSRMRTPHPEAVTSISSEVPQGAELGCLDPAPSVDCPANSSEKGAGGEPSCQGPKNPPAKTHKSSGWKTSKFFSKTMHSGEILRGLKKLSLSSSADEIERKSFDVKSVRNRLSSLRKRSSYSSEEVKTEDADVPLQAESQPPSLTDSQKSSQDDGIVCKKEDILSIISEACKKKPSPTSTKHLPLRQTLSASFDTPSEVRKEPMRRAGSEGCHPRRNLSADCEVTEVSKVSEVKENPQPKTPQEPSPPERDPPDEEPEWSTVKWDESAVVDAVLIGDAIESFLKVSMTSGEKRVSFRKS